MKFLDDLAAERRRFLTRRWFLRDCGVGLGGIALHSLLAGKTRAVEATNLLAPKKPHHEPTAKRVDLPLHGRRAEPSRTL